MIEVLPCMSKCRALVARMAEILSVVP